MQEIVVLVSIFGIIATIISTIYLIYQLYRSYIQSHPFRRKKEEVEKIDLSQIREANSNEGDYIKKIKKKHKEGWK